MQTSRVQRGHRTRPQARGIFELLENRVLCSLTPVGPEFRVNTSTAHDQVGAAVAVDADGDFVAVWASAETSPGVSEGEPGPMHNVFGRRYNAAGAPQGSEFLVTTTTVDDQTLPDVAMDAAGNFVVVWTAFGQDGGGAGVYGRRFSAAGAALGGEFRVNTYTTSSQGSPSIAMDTDGDFVVAWDSYGQEIGAVGFGVYAQRYNSAGVAQGAEMHVNTFTTGYQRTPDVALDAVGNFVVTWESFDQDGSGIGVYARRYNAAGIALSGESRINAFTTNTQSEPSIASDDAGNFVIAWVSRDQDGSSDGIFVRRFTAAGDPLSGEVKVNAFTTAAQRGATVDADADGDFVVAWHSQSQDGAEYGVYAQQYSASGAPQGGEIRVNAFTTGSQAGPTVALDASGDAVIAWTSAPQDGSGSGIYAQRYISSPAPAVTQSNFNPDTLPQRLSFMFNQNVLSTISLNDIVVQQLPAGPTFAPTGINYDAASNTVTYLFSVPLPDGRFRARLIASGIGGPGGPLPADHFFEFTFLRGDANRDGAVNSDDFNILAINFGLSGKTFSQGNFNYDALGLVNSDDFNILAGNFGASLGAASSVRRGTSMFGSPSGLFATGRMIDLPQDNGDDVLPI
jgi:hypothetical protein